MGIMEVVQQELKFEQVYGASNQLEKSLKLAEGTGTLDLHFDSAQGSVEQNSYYFN